MCNLRDPHSGPAEAPHRAPALAAPAWRNQIRRAPAMGLSVDAHTGVVGVQRADCVRMIGIDAVGKLLVVPFLPAMLVQAHLEPLVAELPLRAAKLFDSKYTEWRRPSKPSVAFQTEAVFLRPTPAVVAEISPIFRSRVLRPSLTLVAGRWIASGRCSAPLASFVARLNKLLRRGNIVKQ